MLKMVVCIKAVPDPKQACNIRIDPATKTLMRCDVPLVINPLDRHALEAALKLKEGTEAEIAVISMGPPDAASIVKEGLALGADKGYLLSDKAFGGADAFATAYTLARGIEKIGPFDAVFCGMASSDGATEWVGPEMATFLGVPVVTRVKEITETQGQWWKIKAGLENGYRLMRVKLPAVFTVTRDLNHPRSLSFSGVIQARSKEITQWDLTDLGVPAERLGLPGSPTIVSDLQPIRKKRKAQILSGTRAEKAAQMVQKLAEYGVL